MRRASSARVACGLALAAPVLLPLLAGAGRLAGPDPAPRLACRVLPNGRVPLLAAGAEGCPLPPHARVRAEAGPRGARPFRGERAAARSAHERGEAFARLGVAGEEGFVWHRVAVRAVGRRAGALEALGGAVVAAALVAIPALLARRSAAPAATPFALFYAAASMPVALRLAELRGAWASRAELAAVLLAPAALAHLALVFPLRRRVTREAPRLAALPYAASLLLLPAALRALERDGLLWPALVGLAVLATAGLWALVVGACALALRESRLPVARARARALVVGAALLPALLAPLLAGSGEPAELGARALLASVAVGPLPVGLAASRYNLFDLGTHARRLAARGLVYATAAGAACALVAAAGAAPGSLEARPPLAPLFALAFAFAAGVDGIRRALLGRLESALAPEERRRRVALERSAQRAAELCAPHEVAHRLAGDARRALGAAGVAVFLAEARGWRPAGLAGEAPFRPEDAAFAAARLGARSCRQPSAEEPPSGEARAEEAELEAVAELRAAGERVGLALVAPRADGRPLASPDLGLLRAACTHAAVALRNARLAEELAAAERQAAVGRLSLALAHDLGKELDWMRRLARRLPERLGTPERAARDAATLGELADGVVGSVRRFVRDAAREACGAPERERVPLAALVDRSVREAARLHPGAGGRVSVGLDPALRSAAVPAELAAVLRNLLDNALRAAPAGSPVRVSAARSGKELRLEVADRGPGLPPAARRRAFDPGFTTRGGEGGSGAGLAIARAVAEGLGGSVRLGPGPEGGTRARVTVPLERGGAA